MTVMLDPDMMRIVKKAGTEAVHGFNAVLEAMMDPDLLRQYKQLSLGDNKWFSTPTYW